MVDDKKVRLILTGNGNGNGNGDAPEPGVAAIAPGGSHALAAARALANYEHNAGMLCRKALEIAAAAGVYATDRVTIEMLRSTM